MTRGPLTFLFLFYWGGEEFAGAPSASHPLLASCGSSADVGAERRRGARGASRRAAPPDGRARVTRTRPRGAAGAWAEERGGGRRRAAMQRPRARGGRAGALSSGTCRSRCTRRWHRRGRGNSRLDSSTIHPQPRTCARMEGRRRRGAVGRRLGRRRRGGGRGGAGPARPQNSRGGLARRGGRRGGDGAATDRASALVRRLRGAVAGAAAARVDARPRESGAPGRGGEERYDARS